MRCMRCASFDGVDEDEDKEEEEEELVVFGFCGVSVYPVE